MSYPTCMFHAPAINRKCL